MVAGLDRPEQRPKNSCGIGYLAVLAKAKIRSGNVLQNAQPLGAEVG